MEEIEIRPSSPMQQFEQVRRTDEFVKYQKEFAELLTAKLCKEYPYGEVPSVKAINDFISSYPNLTKRGLKVDNIQFDLIANSLFIHGKKAQVQFSYPGQIKEPVELGDLIFICTLVIQGKRYLEKITISQFKQDNDTRNVFSWTINNDKQLYLLSRFPKFRCVEGIFPKKEYCLPNYSGCLGSYGLIQKPGELVFVSATRLNIFLGKTKTIRKNELYEKPFLYVWRLFYSELFNNCQFCPEVYSFADNYLSLNIGEPTVVRFSNYNLQVKRLLGYLAHSLRAKPTHGPYAGEIRSFIDSFRRFPYEDGFGRDESMENLPPSDENNGVAVVHTTINLGG
jgi:hypothetical protein